MQVIQNFIVRSLNKLKQKQKQQNKKQKNKTKQKQKQTKSNNKTPKTGISENLIFTKTDFTIHQHI